MPLPKCSLCGSDDLIVFYNKRVSDHYVGVRERITTCNYCKTSEVKKESTL
jgi:hypothetical protein